MKLLEIESRVNTILMRVLDIYTDIKHDQEITKDLGADSLDLIEIMIELEKEFNIKIDGDNMDNISTVGELIYYIDRMINGHYIMNDTKDEMEKIPKTEIDDYILLHGKFSLISREIFTKAKLKNLLTTSSLYKGFYFTTDDLVIIYNRLKNSDEKSEFKIGIKYLNDGTWKEYIDNISKKAWTCLDKDMKEHLKSKYESLKPKHGEEVTEYQKGQMKILEDIYGRLNLEL